MAGGPLTLDIYTPINATVLRAARQLAGRRVSAEEARRMIRADLEQVIARWRVYGAWVERVESGDWYADWKRS